MEATRCSKTSHFEGLSKRAEQDILVKPMQLSNRLRKRLQLSEAAKPWQHAFSSSASISNRVLIPPEKVTRKLHTPSCYSSLAPPSQTILIDPAYTVIQCPVFLLMSNWVHEIPTLRMRTTRISPRFLVELMHKRSKTPILKQSSILMDWLLLFRLLHVSEFIRWTIRMIS